MEEAAAPEEEENDEEKKRPRSQFELERAPEFKPPYTEIKLSRGQTKQGSVFTAKAVDAGVIRGEFKLVEKSEASKPLLDMDRLRNPTRVVVRLYILRGRVVPKDSNGLCDPYLCVTNGPSTSYKRRDDKAYKAKTLEPEYYAYYEVPCTLPAQGEVTVAVWDWDRLGSDELVGVSKIDVAQRFFSPSWRALGPRKPVELRPLWHPTSSIPQGHLEMWVDIFTEEEARMSPPIIIGPPPALNFELRVVVWDTKDVAFRDEKMSDVYIVAYVHPSNPQKSDVHYRCTDGKALFNWRFVFPIGLPTKTGPRLTVQMWDKDVFNPNDIIAEANINLRGLCRQAYKGKKSVSLPRQFAALTHPNYSGSQGKIELTVDLLTEDEARRNPVGKGRDPPCPLPFPKRPDTSFAFWRFDKYITKLFWGKYKCCIITSIVVAVIILIIIGILIIKFATPFF
jgi:hypothetical protein